MGILGFVLGRSEQPRRSRLVCFGYHTADRLQIKLALERGVACSGYSKSTALHFEHGVYGGVVCPLLSVSRRFDGMTPTLQSIHV